jgi:hypothetical protein
MCFGSWVLTVDSLKKSVSAISEFLSVARDGLDVHKGLARLEDQLSPLERLPWYGAADSTSRRSASAISR